MLITVAVTKFWMGPLIFVCIDNYIKMTVLLLLLSGSMGTAVVRVLEGQMANISTSHPLYLDFLDADKNVLQEISVAACNGLFRGEATFPASTDFLQLRGTDVYRVPFSYIRPAIDAPVIFRPSRFSLTSTSGGVVSISTGSTHTLTYQLQAVETEGSTSFNFSLQTSTSGFDTNVSPAQAVISANQSVTVSVQVTPTSHVAAGNHQITLSATSGCDTLSAIQSVTVNTLVHNVFGDFVYVAWLAMGKNFITKNAMV